MSDLCVFCKILEGKIPSTPVAETARVLAFIDIGPIVKGHVLVIPKAHYECLTEVPPDLLAEIMTVAQQVARAQFEGLKADGVNVFQANGAAAGQVVPHVHVHVIPRFDNDGHRWNWRSESYADPAEATTLAEKIRLAMG